MANKKLHREKESKRGETYLGFDKRKNGSVSSPHDVSEQVKKANGRK